MGGGLLDLGLESMFCKSEVRSNTEGLIPSCGLVLIQSPGRCGLGWDRAWPGVDVGWGWHRPPVISLVNGGRVQVTVAFLGVLRIQTQFQGHSIPLATLTSAHLPTTARRAGLFCCEIVLKSAFGSISCCLDFTQVERAFETSSWIKQRGGGFQIHSHGEAGCGVNG